MLVRCARCQATFEADRFGVLTCPHCGGAIHLADPGAPAASPPPAPEGPPPPPPAAAPPPPPAWGPPPGAGPGPAPGGPFSPGGPGWATPEQAAPFAERSRLGFLRSYLETWKLTAIEPSTFFRRVRIDQAGSAVLFGVIASTLGGWAQAFWTSLTAASTKAQMAELSEKVPPQWAGLAKALAEYTEKATSTASLTGQALAAPVFAVVGIFVSAAVFHALLVLVRGAKRGFDATLTVVGYATGLSLLQVIPECGALVAPFWAAVVLIVGFSEAHRCGTGRSAAAVLLPLLLACACACAVAFAAFGAGIGALGATAPKAF